MVQFPHIPEYPQRLPGTIWGITVFFNPAGYKNKRKNYLQFRESLKKQGLQLLAVELGFVGTPYQLTKEDAEILIQLRTNSQNALWQKEALLNIALDHLPKDCDKIVWLDCDIIFKNQDWVQKTTKLLERYVVVQPFDTFIRLKKSQYDLKNFDKVSYDFVKGRKWYGIAYSVAHQMKDALIEGHPGFVFAARRDVLGYCGFFDHLVLGSADTVMAYAFYGFNGQRLDCILLTDGLLRSYRAWRDKLFQQVKGSVYYVPGHILHLWHGTERNRKYGARNYILKHFDFDPYTDIQKDAHGVWVWSSPKINLHLAVRDYFYQRNEDSLIYSWRWVKRWMKKKLVRMSGLIGRLIKILMPFLYQRLKKFFPDKVV